MACLEYEDLPFDHRDNGGNKIYYDLNCFIHGKSKKLFPKNVRQITACMNEDKLILIKEQWNFVSTIIGNKYNTKKVTPILYFDFLVKMPSYIRGTEFKNDFYNTITNKHFQNPDNYTYIRERLRTIDVDKYYYPLDEDDSCTKKIQQLDCENKLVEGGEKKETQSSGPKKNNLPAEVNSRLPKPNTKRVCLLKESLERNHQHGSSQINTLHEIKKLDSWDID
jgi:hypothetical protein